VFSFYFPQGNWLNRVKELEGNNVEGLLVIKNPWPSIARTIYQDHKRYVETYMQPYPGYFYTGDGAARDEHGYIWIKGRVDGVLVAPGFRLSSTLLIIFIPRCYQRFWPPLINRRDRVCTYSTQGRSRNSCRWKCR
jgi:acyl-CoA synthetase (AMP-forming)/AMP-acid ligase II